MVDTVCCICDAELIEDAEYIHIDAHRINDNRTGSSYKVHTDCWEILVEGWDNETDPI
jgi:hypothetical protein